MISIALALVSAVAYGTSDFFGAIASRRINALRVILLTYPVSTFLIAAAAPFVGGRLSPEALLWGGASGVATAVAIWWYYLALADGPISVVSPVAAILVTAIPVIAGVALGERPSMLAVVGIVLAVIAIPLVSRSGAGGTDERRFTPRVAWFTVGSGVLFGLSFVFTGQMPADGGLWPLAFARAVAAAVIIVAALRLGRAKPVGGGLFWLTVMIGVFDAVANVAMLYAFRTGLLSLASVVISLYPAVTVAFAVGVVREGIGRVQMAGLGLAGAAILTIAVGG
ncbi:DMT family transporter [Microbacterium proteolyticum]|uniref:DMT family transporter n=1 Tax=Microbacterium proteolyticum TaxID=1572644 RepID=UPI001FADCC79|nr:EamA family transporter [Microbacterium proteolyticum]MCI9857763.1 DMT family transporter [Microbacterium proteolyticum]